MALSQDATEVVTFRVHFRDGTIADVQIPEQSLEWQAITEDGQVLRKELMTSAVAQLTLVADPITAKLEEVRRWLADLGSNDYHQREAASRSLIAKGREFESMLLAARGAEDPEVAWRLEQILLALDSATKRLDPSDYDGLIRAADEIDLDADAELGDVGGLDIEGTIHGSDVRLSRKTVRSLVRRDLATVELVEELRPVQRITSSEIEERFPAGYVHIDFDTTPSGAETELHEPVESMYSERGVGFSTDLPGGFIGIFDYPITTALSGERSAGGQVPDTSTSNYQGVTSVTFHLPGQPEVGATVHYFGCFVSLVESEGTIFKYFDPQGRLISSLTTTVNGADFVGCESETPIARVEIHPTEKDPNYAFDDVIFDLPQAQVGDGALDLVTLLLASGERYQAKSFEVQQDVVELRDLTLGISSVSVSKDDIRVIVPQVFESVVGEGPPSLWARLVDGSQVRCEIQGETLVMSGDTSRAIEWERIQSLWYGKSIPALGSKADSLSEWPSVIDEEGVAVKVVKPHIEGGQFSWSTGDEQDVRTVASDELGFLSLRSAGEEGYPGWVRLGSGEGLVLGAGEGRLIDWDSDSVTIEYQGKQQRWEWRDLQSLKIPAPPAP